MTEYKISVMRNFGTEQFSMTATFSDKPSKDEADKAIDVINFSIDKQFLAVQGREISEKALVIERSKERQQVIEEHTKQLQSEADAAKKLGKLVK